MDDLEQKLGAVLSNPQLMSQIMTMAQSMGAQAPPKQESVPTAAPLPEIDLGMLQKLSGFARQSGIDKDQQALLNALSPFLSRTRISKLEKAMRAAKMARFASSLLDSGVLQFPLGR